MRYTSSPRVPRQDKAKALQDRRQSLEGPIQAEELKDSVCIFDDIDVISDKKIKESVYSIMNNVLEIGRHFNITAIITNHLPTNGRDTRRILNEAHAYVFFPHSAGGKIKYLLQEYLDIDKRMVRYFKSANPRWRCIFKNFPMAYMLEHEIGMLHANEEDDEPLPYQEQSRQLLK